jgi:hypothetical protein
MRRAGIVCFRSAARTTTTTPSGHPGGFDGSLLTHGGRDTAGVLIGAPAVSAATTETKKAYEVSFRNANRGGQSVPVTACRSKAIGATGLPAARELPPLRGDLMPVDEPQDATARPVQVWFCGGIVRPRTTATTKCHGERTDARSANWAAKCRGRDPSFFLSCRAPGHSPKTYFTLSSDEPGAAKCFDAGENILWYEQWSGPIRSTATLPSRSQQCAARIGK